MQAWIATIAATAVALAGCGVGNGQEPREAPHESPTRPTTATTAAPASPSASPTVPAAGTVITTGQSEFGVMLFDETGQAIYLFDKESTTRPECYDACADAWPPVLTMGVPQGTGEARHQLLGRVRRTDGKVQITYAGHPLYYYAHEAKNEVRCHNVTGFGGLWRVVTPSGRPAA